LGKKRDPFKGQKKQSGSAIKKEKKNEIKGSGKGAQKGLHLKREPPQTSLSKQKKKTGGLRIHG